MYKKAIFKGSGVAIVTPFTQNDEIDFESFGKHIEFLIENGSDAIIVCGTTGEASTMSEDEHVSAVEFCVKTVNKRVPVIAGAGSNNSKKSIKLAKRCEEAGVDALLIVTPYYNKASKQGLIEHFTTIHDETNTPIILYNVPSRTNVNIPPDVCFELSKLERIVGIKEASGDISQVARIAALCEGFPIYSGNDDQTLATCAVGGIGVVSVLGNIAPRETHDMVQAFLDGDYKKSLELQRKYLDLCEKLFIEPNPIPVKAALHRMGYNNGKLRLPLCPIDKCNKKELFESMDKVL